MNALSAANRVQRGRLPSLDGWRAIAIVLVLVSHTVYTLDCPEGLDRFISHHVSGNLGVRIFFTISGFIITWLLIQEANRSGSISLSRFYLRRCLRIFPVYFCYLAVLGILSYRGRYIDAPSSWLGALTFSRNLFGRGDSATVHFWSLAVEEQFYVCWPIAFKLLKLNRRSGLAIIILVMAVVLANSVRFFADVYGQDILQSDRVYGARSLLRYADCIAIGCLAAYFYSVQKRVPKNLVYATWALLLGDFAMEHFAGDLLSRIEWLLPTVEAGAIALLILDSIERAELYRILNTRFAISVGLVSYSLYIWHVMFVHHFAPSAVPIIWQEWYLWSVPAIAVAYVSYYGLELPLARLKNRFAR